MGHEVMGIQDLGECPKDIQRSSGQNNKPGVGVPLQSNGVNTFQEWLSSAAFSCSLEAAP
jgi:hypothetical protein